MNNQHCLYNVLFKIKFYMANKFGSFLPLVVNFCMFFFFKFYHFWENQNALAYLRSVASLDVKWGLKVRFFYRKNRKQSFRFWSCWTGVCHIVFVHFVYGYYCIVFVLSLYFCFSNNYIVRLYCFFQSSETCASLMSLSKATWLDLTHYQIIMYWHRSEMTDILIKFIPGSADTQTMLRG